MITFGNRDQERTYPVREAAYGLLIEGDYIALAHTPRGYFLLGGGIEEGEDHETCIVREFVEELGMVVQVTDFEMTTRFNSITPSRDFPIDMVAHCYHVKSTDLRKPSIEEDHAIQWMTLEKAAKALTLVHQSWVVEVLTSKKPQKTITTYNKHWVSWFEALSVTLSHALKGNIIGIEHVGSTAIPGMLAKPTIDMDVIIENMNGFEAVCDKLKALGYEHQGDLGIKEREAFKRNNRYDHELLDHLPHHLYVCPLTSKELERHLKLRDRLRSEPALRDAYNAVKEEIIVKVGPYDRSGYVEMKENQYKRFFERLLA